MNPYMLTNQPYDVNKDFIPVTLLAKVPNLFVIHRTCHQELQRVRRFVKKNRQGAHGSAVTPTPDTSRWNT